MKKQHIFREGFWALPRLLPISLAKNNRFFFKFIPIHPTDAGLSVTNNCNSQCVHCLCWRCKSSNELSLDEIEDALIQLRELGVSRIVLGGGEPTVRKDLPEIVRTCSSLKFNEVWLLTNGLLLDGDLIRQLLEAGLTSIGVSIDGLEETSDAIRGRKGGFKKAISALSLLSELKQKEYRSLYVYVAMVLMKQNLNQVVQMVNLVSELKVKLNLCLINSPSRAAPELNESTNNISSLHPLTDVADLADLWFDDQLELDRVINELHAIKKSKTNVFPFIHTHASLEYARRYFKDPKRADVPCIVGHNLIAIGACGEVYSGCRLVGTVGNVREKSLKEIVASAEYKGKLEAVFYKECPGCSANYNLNLWHHLPSIKDEIRWRIKPRALMPKT